jgi:BirA family transcriptional regulator, biotin operon repressor / biotin---[acetyl-CoA-carboxylase] ligase
VAETGSTNADALTAARTGDEGKLWITADQQVSGRGRQGRVWVSEPGNLYASALMIDPAPAIRISTLPFVAALALHSALSSLPDMARHELKLKWPNDLLANGSKISGILLESENLDNGSIAVTCGFGVNIAHHPEPALYTATDLAALGIKASPQQVFVRLADALDTVLSAWNHGRSFAAIRHEWLSLAKGRGEPIRINLAGSVTEGIFEDIDMDGCLLLRHRDRTIQKISAGDVFFPQSIGASR